MFINNKNNLNIMEKSDLEKYAVMVLIFTGLIGFLIIFRGGGFTGYAVFEDNEQSEFNLGTYTNTIYNGSAVVLSSGQVSGTYTSKIFDAGDVSVWNNLSYSKNIPFIEFLFATDNQADVWKSIDSGVSWSLIKDDYNNGDNNGGTHLAKNSSGSLFILFNQDVWKSIDSGATWIKINDDYNGAEGQNGYVLGIDNNNNLIIIEGDQDVWKSTDSGAIWSKVTTDFNGGNGNIFGISVNSNNIIFVVDGAADVWKSTDSGSTWTLVKDDYNGANGNNADDMAVDSNNNLYVLDVQDVFKSTDSGVTWEKINDDFNGAGDAQSGIVIGTDSNNNVYVIDGGEDIFKSGDGGISFTKIATDFNGANLNVFGLTSLIENSSLTFSARSCDDTSCSGESWVAVNNPLSLGLSNNRYFQYKIDFTSPDTSVTPSLTNINIDYTLVNTAPVINIASPQNSQSYSVKDTINLNFTASDNDGNLQSCWYKLDNGNNVSLSGCANTTISASSIGTGNHIIYVYVNDSLGLIGSNSVSFSVINTAPTLNLVSPQNGANYGYNESLALNFSVSDTDNNLQSCWYNINNGANIILVGCANTTFNVAGNGQYTFNIYANDSLGLETSDSATFNVAVSAPTIILNSPIDNYLNYKNNILFSYTPTDIDLDYCELWADFDGQFKLNQTDNSPTSGSENTFTISSLSDGTYKWNIRCNDSLGHSAFNGNKTFYIDTINPVVSLTQPFGTKTLRTGIPLEFLITDTSPTTCLYNVKYTTGQEVLGNTTINCSSTSFAVSTDGDYVLSFYVKDFANNLNSASLSFSVDTSTPVSPPSGGGSSGGGGGGGGGIISNVSGIGKLQVSLIGDIIARSGDNKKISLNVKNIGRIFLNKCKLISSGETKSWIYSSQINGIAPGETLDFNFDLNVPEGINSGDYSGELEIKCDEGSDIQKISVSIPGLEAINIREMIQEGRNLVINYSFDNSNFIGDFVIIDIWISDEAGNEIKRIQDKFDINKEGLIDRNVEIDVSGLSGIYYVNFALSSNLKEFVRQSIILGKTSTTGFAILDFTQDNTIIYVIFVLLVGIAVFFILRRSDKKE